LQSAKLLFASLSARQGEPGFASMEHCWNSGFTTTGQFNTYLYHHFNTYIYIDTQKRVMRKIYVAAISYSNHKNLKIKQCEYNKTPRKKEEKESMELRIQITLDCLSLT
jgi:hypothetical protein